MEDEAAAAAALPRFAEARGAAPPPRPSRPAVRARLRCPREPRPSARPARVLPRHAALPCSPQALNSTEHASRTLGLTVLAIVAAPATITLILPAPPAPPAPPPPPEPLDVELIVGCVVGGVVFVALLAGRAAG